VPFDVSVDGKGLRIPPSNPRGGKRKISAAPLWLKGP